MSFQAGQENGKNGSHNGRIPSLQDFKIQIQKQWVLGRLKVAPMVAKCPLVTR